MSLCVETDPPHYDEDGESYLDTHDEKVTTAISFIFFLLIFIVTGALHMGMVLLSTLFAYFALSKLHFIKRGGKWLPIVLFLTLLGGAAYGLAYFIQATATALPSIAAKALPAVTEWAGAHHIRLPFTDFNSLKEQILKAVTSGAQALGKFAEGATTQFVYLIVGIVVAMGIFIHPTLANNLDPEEKPNTLYAICREKFCHRIATFYESFALVISAQVIISSIDTTLTGIFVGILHLPYLAIAVVATFLCGLIPVVGNLLSNTLITGIGFMVSPLKGLLALGYLICIHQLEYLLNSKIIGGKIRTPLWLTFLGLVVGEGLMGITGIIIAPAVLHYIRVESSRVLFRTRKRAVLEQPHP